MAITKRDPNTILLAGDWLLENSLAASEAITPGMLVETFASAGVNRWRKHSTAAGPCRSVMKDMPMLNKGIDDACAAADLIEVIEGSPGASFYGIIASGANISFGDKLESAGNGKLRAWTASVTPMRALETVNNSAGPGDARIRVEVL
jgi:hypothetical protein